MEATRGGLGGRSPGREEEGGMKAAGAMARSADPAVLFRAEGGVLLVLSVLLYLLNGCSWVLFGLLLFAPDLSALGYLAGPRVGAAAYNFFHTYAVPALLAAYSLLGEAPQPSLWPWSGSRTSPWIVWWATGLNIPRSSVQHSQRNPRHSPERVG
jgi:hypothetical protein